MFKTIEVLGVIEPCFVMVLDVMKPFYLRFLMLMNLSVVLVLDVIEPCFLLGSDGMEPLIIGGFRGYHHA